MTRKLEIYGTLGPACASVEILRQMFAEGITGMRLNLSHTTLTGSDKLIGSFHDAAAAEGVTPSLLIDLQGPELRVGRFPSPVRLEKDALVRLVPNPAGGVSTCTKGSSSDASGCGAGPASDAPGPVKAVPPDRPEITVPPALLQEVSAGTRLLLDDGKILLETAEVSGDGQERVANAVVRTGGILQSSKSIAAEGLEVPGETLTQQDIVNLRYASAMGVTDVMQPCVRGARDLTRVREAMRENGAGRLRLFAKIENRAGAEALGEIIPHADMIVIARGDLGNSLPLYRLPVLQHYLAAACRAENAPFMVVTQMLASMENSPVPTRAEVSDIFRAVAEGAGAIMVTGETAGGRYPVEASRYLVRTAQEALRYFEKADGRAEKITGNSAAELIRELYDENEYGRGI